MINFKILSIFILSCVFIGCNSSEEKRSSETISDIKKDSKTVITRNVSQEFKDYWYAGKAEITSYLLMQERYGEIREGTAVNIFVAEDFLPNEQVKANNASEENISVLNKDKSYVTQGFIASDWISLLGLMM